MTVNNNIICELSHLGLLEVSGADAMTFLQGQVTNDVKLLAGNNAHFSAYCTPKGRMLALFLAFALTDKIYLQFNRELLEPILKRLKMYVMRSKVEIRDVSDDIMMFGIDGPEAVSILSRNHVKIPMQDYELTTSENFTFLKLPTVAGHTRFEIFADVAQAKILFETLQTECKIVEKSHWDWLEIQAGVPDVTLKTQEQFVPQMLNLDILNGINFKKGCYTGQEIVARTHYLGSVKRRTYLAEITSKESPKAGDKVLDATQNEVGQVVRVAKNFGDGFDTLIEMRIEAADTEKVYWNSVLIQFKDLPYRLEA